MNMSVHDKSDPISLYLERFPEHDRAPDPRFPFVPTHPMSRALKLASTFGTMPALRMAAEQALIEGEPIRDWSACTKAWCAD
jgi:hypothetical protein